MNGARRLLIVGGGPAALATARGYRDASGDGEITLLTPELTPPYERPPLSKEFLRGTTSEDELPLEPPSWYAEHGVDVRLGDSATATQLDTAARTVLLRGGDALHYDVCVLATGSEPVRLPVPGAEHPDVLLLRSLVDARALRARAQAGARRAVVIGSGFIGCEAAASLALRGLSVTLVSDEDIPHAARLGEQAGERVASMLREHGIALVLGSGIDSIEDGERVHVPGHAPLHADLILMAAGARPRVELAAQAGLDTHDGRVVVDERMRTSADGVLAAGDLVHARNEKAGRHLSVEHWGEALNMGEVAGRTAAGEDAAWDVAPGFWSDIGARTLKYAAWGDGFDEARLVDHGDQAFTVWYGREGTTVGVLAHARDDDYGRGRELVERGAPLP